MHRRATVTTFARQPCAQMYSEQLGTTLPFCEFAVGVQGYFGVLSVDSGAAWPDFILFYMILRYIYIYVYPATPEF